MNGEVYCTDFKNKSDVQSCKNIKGVNMIGRTLKIREGVVEALLKRGTIGEQLYDFIPRKSTIGCLP